MNQEAARLTDLQTETGILLLGGGYPLRTDKKIYGGIGVSGGTKEQDTTLAMVATRILKHDSLEEVGKVNGR